MTSRNRSALSIACGAFAAVQLMAHGAALAGPAPLSPLADLEGESVRDGLAGLSAADGDFVFEVLRPGGTFSVVDLSAGAGTTAFGTRSISPGGDGGGPFVVNFSVPVTSFSVTLGDFGDDADALTLRAFSGADLGGAVLDAEQQTLVPVDDNFSFVTLEVGGPAIRSVEIGGASVAVDNLAATPVPLPAAVFAFPAAAALAGLYARRLRRGK